MSFVSSGIIPSLGSANERRRYYVTPPLIGGAHAKNGPWKSISSIFGSHVIYKKI